MSGMEEKQEKGSLDRRILNCTKEVEKMQCLEMQRGVGGLQPKKYGGIGAEWKELRFWR